jgi:hypothetical protein
LEVRILRAIITISQCHLSLQLQQGEAKDRVLSNNQQLATKEVIQDLQQDLKLNNLKITEVSCKVSEVLMISHLQDLLEANQLCLIPKSRKGLSEIDLLRIDIKVSMMMMILQAISMLYQLQVAEE